MRSWLLKENADLFAQPVADILNCSFQEARLPSSWKDANIVPVPKEKPIRDVNKHLRPISLTPVLSKLAEDYVVEQYVKPAVLARVDANQFGTVPGSNTTIALISILHSWLCDTDGNGATVRAILLDFRKAFDLIDHKILVRKLMTYSLPSSIITWITDFLSCRRQRVKLSQDCFSEWGSIPSGVPQGTKLGPWLFVIMIDDLSTTENCNMWKYVDDTTISEVVQRSQNSDLQRLVDDLSRQVAINGFQLNEGKCKELRISFSRSPPDFDPIVVNSKDLECVQKAKMLGVTFSVDLKWNAHVDEIVKKVNKRLYFLRQLKRAQVKSKELVLFYLTCIRSVMEYACALFHSSLPQYLSVDLERCQKRALRIMFPDKEYDEALACTGLISLHERRENIANKLFSNALVPGHKLHKLLPPRNVSSVDLRKKRVFNLPVVRTDRCRNSFIFHHSRTLCKS